MSVAQARSTRSGLLALGLAVLCAQGAIGIYRAALPLYLERLGLDAPTIGALVGLTPLAQAPGALVTGPLIDRLGGRRMLVSGRRTRPPRGRDSWEGKRLT